MQRKWHKWLWGKHSLNAAFYKQNKSQTMWRQLSCTQLLSQLSLSRGKTSSLHKWFFKLYNANCMNRTFMDSYSDAQRHPQHFRAAQ